MFVRVRHWGGGWGNQMGDGDPRYIFDSVHGLISFTGDTGELLFDLINTAEVQRLRRIHQLGMSPCVFPGASHSRFAHSIGMLHVTSRFIDRFRRVAPPVTEDDERVVLVAALLHDVGHGPYSHVFEKAAKENHEKRTAQIVLSAETEVNRVLTSVDPSLPQKVASLFGDVPPPDWTLPLHLRQTISSQLDADRFDYLLRDSHYTGVDYGTFDSHWLLEHIFVDEYRGSTFPRRRGMLLRPTFLPDITCITQCITTRPQEPAK